MARAMARPVSLVMSICGAMHRTFVSVQSLLYPFRKFISAFALAGSLAELNPALPSEDLWQSFHLSRPALNHQTVISGASQARPGGFGTLVQSRMKSSSAKGASILSPGIACLILGAKLAH
jgi:hypothetical protein